MAPDPDIELRRMIGSYLRQCRRDAKVSLTALVRRAKAADKTITCPLLSSYEHGRYVPTLQRLRVLLSYVGAEPTPEIVDAYRRLADAAPHMGQLIPGHRDGNAEARRLIHAWQTSETVAEAAAKLNMPTNILLGRVSIMRRRGVPLKYMSGVPHQYDWGSLADYARDLVDKDADGDVPPDN